MHSRRRPLNVSEPWPDGETVFLAGLDPNRVSLRALRRAEMLAAMDEIPAREIPAVAERLTAEEAERDIARQALMDYEDALATNSRG